MPSTKKKRWLWCCHPHVCFMALSFSFKLVYINIQSRNRHHENESPFPHPEKITASFQTWTPWMYGVKKPLDSHTIRWKYPVHPNTLTTTEWTIAQRAKKKLKNKKNGNVARDEWIMMLMLPLQIGLSRYVIPKRAPQELECPQKSTTSFQRYNTTQKTTYLPCASSPHSNMVGWIYPVGSHI